MKKILFSALLLSMFSNGKACADYYPDGDYFSLFTQTIIKDKTYIPFLFTYGQQFYSDGVKRMIPNENIFSWQKFFGKKLDYRETEFLVNHMSMDVLNSFKKGNNSDFILKKLGSYAANSEAIDYLIEAKYLEPFMLIQKGETENYFYDNGIQKESDVSALDYQKTVSVLVSLYNAAQNPEIKQRYGYQIVRFYHYNRNYEQAIDAFKTFVEPIKLRAVPYFYALDQMAGAQRGLKMNDEANWNFFKVFMNAPSKKEGAFVSMKVSDSASFANILKKTSTPEEKNMAYFLLGYDDFSNPLPNMEKMFEINPESEILKVMAARSINILERSYLETYLNTDAQIQKNRELLGNEPTEVKQEKKLSFWDKVVNFFRNLFGGKKDQKPATTRKENSSDGDLANNPNRIPVFQDESSYYRENPPRDYLDDFSKFTEKTKEKSKDEFWQIADAYLKFLQKDFKSSNEILASIKTVNPEYKEQITRMKMLNDITAQPKIDADFENHISKTYPDIFTEKKVEKDTTDYYYFYDKSTPLEFVKDVLANRYFLQNEDGKSYLVHNKLSDLQYYPDPALAKKVQDFVKKPNKTALEVKLTQGNIDLKNPDAFFNIIYGDAEMRKGDFSKAKSFYSKAIGFEGIPRISYDYGPKEVKETKMVYGEGSYDGFHNVSNLVFGHNVWESFQSSEEQSLKAETFVHEFPFIKDHMNKLELAAALEQLQKKNSANANQLIGNVLYNTSALGYFRELFIMDIDNSPWAKNDIFRQTVPEFQYYYKKFDWGATITPDNFDVAISFYDKALKQSQNKEQKTRILFQMASAEQGKYYQWEAKQPGIPYSSENWEQQEKERDMKFAKMKNEKFRTYFNQMKQNYGTTQTSRELMGSCSYYDYFMKK